MINHSPFTSPARPRALLWTRSPTRFAIALPLGAHRARLQNCSRTGPLAKQMLSHWSHSRGRGWSEPSFGVAGLWARKSGGGSLPPQICGHGGPPPRNEAHTPLAPRHWHVNGSAHTPQAPRHWLVNGSARTPLAPRHWHVNGFAFGVCGSSFADAPRARPKGKQMLRTRLSVSKNAAGAAHGVVKAL